MKVKVEVLGGPFDGDILEVDANRIHNGIIVMLDTTKMRMSTPHRFEKPVIRQAGDRLVTEPSKTPPPDTTSVPSVYMDIRRHSNGKYYVFWPEEN